MTSRLRLLALLVAAPIGIASPARALAGDSAAAQALFDDASRLLSQHRIAEACGKLAESQRQDPGIGTLYHYADCEERLGKTAAAWAAFREVASEAMAQGQTARATVAKGRASALEPRLARLTVDPGAEKGTPGLQLYRDGELLGPGEWASAIPVDPGAHVVEARAPGKGPWTATVSSVDGGSAVVTVPLLADLGLPPADVQSPVLPGAASSVTRTTSADVSTPSRGKGQRAAGIVLGVAGIAGMGVGGYFGVASLMHRNDSAAHCNGNVCDGTGVNLRDEAQQAGTAATIALGAGGAVLLAGILTYLTAPSGHRDPLPSAQASSRPVLAIGPGSVVLRGRW